MSSKTAIKKPHFVILGAGISGLTLGWYLRKKFGDTVQLSILESQSRTGGWIQTSHQKGFLLEQGPRSCRPYGAGYETLSLIEQLGLEQELVFASPASKQRYLYSAGSLKALPTGLISLPFSPFAPILLKALWQDWRTPKGDEDWDESIDAFITRRLGKTAAELFFDPLVSGVYAGDITKLSMKSCFPLIHQWEQHSGSLLKGAFSKRPNVQLSKSPFVLNAQKKGLFSLKGGMEALTSSLTGKLEPFIHLNSEAIGLQFNGTKAKIILKNGQILQADHIFSAIPPQALADLIQPHHLETFKALSAIPSVSVGVVNLGYRQPDLCPKGFGYLIPTNERQRILGTVFDSSAFPSQNNLAAETRLTVMIGESQFPKDFEEADSRCLQIALKAVAAHLGIVCKPDCAFIKIAKNAIPQYHIGHSKLLLKIELGLQDLPTPITLLGNGFYGVAVNDCIAKAKAVVDTL